MRQGIALVLSAPSGTGKSTLCKMLRREFPNFGYSISCTTRPMRSGEVHGEDYFFLRREEFEKMRASGQFAEWAQVHGNFYGTPLAPVRNMLNEGVDVLFDIDVQGASQLKATMPEATFVFIVPPSIPELRRRLAERGADDSDNIKLRMRNAKKELREASWYNAVIVNDDLKAAYVSLVAVYRAATLAPTLNRAFLDNLLEQAEAV